MRGKGASGFSLTSVSRITPAYAGKSVATAHSWAGGAGSPPPMRGKGSILLNPVYCGGITPAYAGKSNLSDKYFNKI